MLRLFETWTFWISPTPARWTFSVLYVNGLSGALSSSPSASSPSSSGWDSSTAGMSNSLTSFEEKVAFSRTTTIRATSSQTLLSLLNDRDSSRVCGNKSTFVTSLFACYRYTQLDASVTTRRSCKRAARVAGCERARRGWMLRFLESHGPSY